LPIHVSIHDVAPPFERQLDVALELTRSVGAVPSLLVVPNYHRAWPLTRFASFCRRLRELQGEGHEVLLHGYFHAASDARTVSRSSGFGYLRRAFNQRVISSGEAEFGDLEPDQARQRLSDGERMLEDVGLRVSGFVPPAWTMPRSMFEVLALRGYAYTEDHVAIYDPKARRSRASLLLNYASRDRLRLWSTVAYCRTVRNLRTFLPARIAIHPGDVDAAILRRELRSLLGWARGDFVARAADLLEPRPGVPA